MTRLIKASILAPFLVASLAVQAEEGEWYVSPSIVYTDDDGDRLIDDSIAGGQIQVGREMGEHLALEGLFGYHDIDGFPGQEHLELGFNVISNFLPAVCFRRTSSAGSVTCRPTWQRPTSGDCRRPTRRRTT